MSVNGLNGSGSYSNSIILNSIIFNTNVNFMTKNLTFNSGFINTTGKGYAGGTAQGYGTGPGSVNSRAGGAGYGGSGAGGGSGGSIFITAGTITGSGNITANGGNGGTDSGANSNPGGGGGGGRIYISAVNTSLFGSKSVNPGGSPGVIANPGTMVLNYSSSINDSGTIYGNNVTLRIINSSAGEIRWIPTLNGTALNGRLGTNVTIKNNFVSVDSESTSTLNVSANITLYGLQTNFVNPKIMRDGAVCNATNGGCYNLTSLNAGTIVFNVTGFSNYSIQDVSACPMTLSTANSVYNLTQNLQSNGTCISVTANNITINGAGFNLTGNGTGYGINATNATGPGWNITVQNINISNFSIDIASFGSYNPNEFRSGFVGGYVTVTNATI